VSEEQETRGGKGPAGPSRRGLLKAGMIAGAVAGAGGWRSAPGAAAGSATNYRWPAHLRKPGSLPYPHLPMGTDTIPQIEHIVVAMQENHSYDNRLGMLHRRDADGFTLGRDGLPAETNPYANGDLQHAFHMPTTCQDGSVTQEWKQCHTQFAHGRNDGFVISGSGAEAMGYWDRGDQPFYYSLADVFPIADRYFCSVLGQTYPNRRYLMAATSLGIVDDTIVDDYPKNGTIFDKLMGANLTWRDYYTTLPTTLLFPQLYTKYHGTNILPIAQFFTDAAAGTLPNYSLVEPNYETSSEEDPQNIVLGEAFISQVVNAVMSGPLWKKTLLIWTYDEHGGYYDHVPPPPAIPPDNIPPSPPPGESKYNGFRQYGFRVPCAVVSPWARPSYVSHKVFDHTSTCALVEAKWNLPAMTYRDANANNMLDMLDLHTPTFLTPPVLAQPLMNVDPGSLTCTTTGPGTIPPPGSISPPPDHPRGH
jgi:phospholipase C